MTRNHMNDEERPMFVHEKLCRRCNEAWPVDFFRPDKRGPGYLTTWCRACEADQKREYRARSVVLAGVGRCASKPLQLSQHLTKHAMRVQWDSEQQNRCLPRLGVQGSGD